MTKATGIVSHSVRNAVLLAAAILALVKRQQILYLGKSPDSKYSDPLPPAFFGCPCFGHNIFKATNEGGPGEFFRQASAKLGNSRLFKFMFIGQPIVTVAEMRIIFPMNLLVADYFTILMPNALAVYLLMLMKNLLYIV